jgi:hypothetical protein
LAVCRDAQLSYGESKVTAPSNTGAATALKVHSRKVLNEDALKKISSSLCTKGFKAYVGTNKKNVCQSKASSPDIAYSCIWKKKGTPAYSPTLQGPCNLDYTEHRGNIITKDRFWPYPPSSYGVEPRSNPPSSYGVEAQCCYRAAVGPVTSK